MADAPPIGFMQGKQDVSHKAALEFQGLSFSYASERSASGSDAQERALIDVTGHVHAGEVVAIIGPNGAGKSTLLRLLAGLEKLPTGRITLQGAALADFDHKARARAISLVPQALVSLPEVRVYDFVLSGRYAHQRSLSHASKTDQAVVEQALRDCDVLRFADRLLSQLSSGQRQRVVTDTVLERDVTEGEVDGAVRQIEAASVGDLEGSQTIDAAEAGDGLAAALEEADVEIGGDDMTELAGECRSHAPDARTDLDHRAILVLRVAQAEGLEVGRHLVVAGGDELGQGQ